MGRLNLRALQVYRTGSTIFNTETVSGFNRSNDQGAKPAWLDIVGTVTPAQALVRTQPVQHQRTSGKRKSRKPSKIFMPQHIGYEEDLFRREFYKEHPWELARPRVILEKDGKDHETSDWSRIKQPGRQLDGESVIQRQTWLRKNTPQMTRAQAYDQARTEFYSLRLQQDVERRIAEEEASATGAYFGLSALEIGMGQEDKAFESWKAWATSRAARREIDRNASYASTDDDPEDKEQGNTLSE